MRVNRVFYNERGNKVAELEDGRYIVSNHSMYMYLCEKVKDGYKVVSDAIVSGMMMRTIDDFRDSVEIIREEEIEEAIRC